MILISQSVNIPLMHNDDVVYIYSRHKTYMWSHGIYLYFNHDANLTSNWSKHHQIVEVFVISTDFAST